MKHFLLSIVIIVSGICVERSAIADQRFKDTYLLYIPGLTRGKERGIPTVLAHWDRDNNPEKIYSLTSNISFFSKKVSRDWRRGDFPSSGLSVITNGQNMLIKGTFSVKAGPYGELFELKLQSRKKFNQKKRIGGNAQVKYIRDNESGNTKKLEKLTYRSEWGLKRASDVTVYSFMLSYINNKLSALRNKSSGDITSAKVTAELEKKIKNSKKKDSIWSYLPPQRFVKLLLRELRQSRITFQDGKAKYEGIDPAEVINREKIQKYFDFVDQEVVRPDKEKVEYEPRHKPMENQYTPHQGVGSTRSFAKRLIRENHINKIWRLARDLDWTHEYREEDNYLDFTKKELCYIPGIVVLAEHLSVIPEGTAEKVVEDWIKDGSNEWFPDMIYEQMAAMPSPVFLVACLPHMESERADNLAQTERVKKLLDASGLAIKDIAELSFPALTAKLIRNFKPFELQRMLDLTPKFKEYLKKLKDQGNEKITEIVEHKDLNLSRKGDRAKQLGHRLTEQVIPKMIKALRQAKQEEGGNAQDMIDPLFDYMKPRSNIHLAVKDVWEDPEGLRELSQRVILRLEKARKQRPEFDSSGEYLNAVFHLKNEAEEIKFRYVPNLGSIKWQLLRCGE